MRSAFSVRTLALPKVKSSVGHGRDPRGRWHKSALVFGKENIPLLLQDWDSILLNIWHVFRMQLLWSHSFIHYTKHLSFWSHIGLATTRVHMQDNIYLRTVRAAACMGTVCACARARARMSQKRAYAEERDLELCCGSAVCLASIRSSVFIKASVKEELTCGGRFPPVCYYTHHLIGSRPAVSV